MAESLPIVLVPGLNCSPRLYGPQMPALWRFGAVSVANHTRDDTMAAIASRILGDAPPRFALAGLSMGGYIAFEIMRQAADRVAKLALLDTGARDDSPEAQAKRRTNIAAAEAGRFDEIIDAQFPLYVHPGRANGGRGVPADRPVRRTAEVHHQSDVRAETFADRRQAVLVRGLEVVAPAELHRPKPFAHVLPALLAQVVR